MGKVLNLKKILSGEIQKNCRKLLSHRYVFEILAEFHFLLEVCPSIKHFYPGENIFQNSSKIFSDFSSF